MYADDHTILPEPPRSTRQRKRNWNNKWINYYLHLVGSFVRWFLRLFEECVNEKSTDISSHHTDGGMQSASSTKWQTSDATTTMTSEWTWELRMLKLRCTHNFQFGRCNYSHCVLEWVWVCICSIAFERWNLRVNSAVAATPAPTPASLSFANAFNFGCWFYDFSLSHCHCVGDRYQIEGEKDTQRTGFMTSVEARVQGVGAFLILFLFPVEMFAGWWALMVAPHFLVDETRPTTASPLTTCPQRIRSTRFLRFLCIK